MAQQQKTEGAEIPDIEALEPLSPQEEKFVETLAQTGNNTEAYRAAYGAEGYSPPALHVKACKKAAQAKIQAHLRVLRRVGLDKAGLSLKERVEDERAFMQRCEDAGNFGAAGAARDRINKLLGLYVEKRQEVPAEDPRTTLDEIARINPDYARKLAEQEGIKDWQPVEGGTVH